MLRRLIPIFALLVALSFGAVQAQTPEIVPGWEDLASRAETTLEAGRASDRAIDQLRSELVEYRAEFLARRDENSARIETTQAQIEALGPAPEEGAPPEPEPIAAERAELEAQLARQMAPRLQADAAYRRADGLIREIDETLRARQTNRLTRQGPSPLNPAHWPGAIEDLERAWREMRREAARAWTDEARAMMSSRLPRILVFLVIAFALVLRGRVWMERASSAIYNRGRFRGTDVSAFLVSVGQVIVPMLGLIALGEALDATGVLGLRGLILVEMLPGLGLILFGAIWLGARIFPRDDTMVSVVTMPAAHRRRGRLLADAVGILLVMLALLRRLAGFDDWSDATQAVVLFPLLVVLAGVLAALARLLDRALAPDPAAESGYETEVASDDTLTTASDPGFLQRSFRVALKLIMLSAGLGVLLACLGYLDAARLAIAAPLMSLALVGLLAVLHLLIRDVYALLRGISREAAAASLTPVLLSFLLVVAAAPLFALIWGARATDLAELWAQFTKGFAIGDTVISPGDFLTFALVFGIGYALTRIVQGALKTSVLPKTRLDAGGRNAITSGLGYVGIFLAAIIAIAAAGIDLGNVALVAGALSVGIGFGLQTIVSNFVSGIILLIERPISEGDWVEVNGTMGIVRDISVRSTRIETFDRTDVIVPNADFVSGTVTNWTKGNLVGRVIVPVGVAYGTDTRKVEAILQRVAEANPLVVLKPPPFVLFAGFGGDALNFEIRAILRDVNFVLNVGSEMRHAIAEAFAEEGIEIPFAQRDLWLRNPEVLRDRGDPDRTTDDMA